MKKYILSFLLCCISLLAFAQTDTIPEYKKSPYIPSFTIQKADSSWFNKLDLKKKPTLILYFSPDCGHCQIETEELISHLRSLPNLQIVMITSRDLGEMKNFSDHYMLQKFPSIVIGSDTRRFVSRFFDVKFTPFSALYDKNGKLVKVYKDGIDFDELSSLVAKK